MDNTGKVVLQNPLPGEYTIVHREGEAPVIKILNPATIQQGAIITAPLDFYTVRKAMSVGGKPYFQKEFTHVLVNREAGTLQLVWGENKEDQQSICGKIQKSEQYTELRLNTQETRSPKDLANLLKRFRFLFVDQSEGMKIITELLTFKAEVKTSIVAETDNRGHKKNLVETSVETNMPIKFSMKLQLYKGFEKEKVGVDICFSASTNSVECWLESVDALEWFEKQKQELFDVQLKPFKDDGIAIIES